MIKKIILVLFTLTIIVYLFYNSEVTDQNIKNKKIDSFLNELIHSKEKINKHAEPSYIFIDNEVSHNHNIIKSNNNQILSPAKSINSNVDKQNINLDNIKRININSMIKSRNITSLDDGSETINRVTPLLSFDVVYSDSSSLNGDDRVSPKMTTENKGENLFPPMPPSHIMKQY